MWQWIKCLFGRHDLRLGVNYAPDHTCMTVFCIACQARLYHFDLVDTEEDAMELAKTKPTGKALH
jgi:hypothetical protein